MILVQQAGAPIPVLPVTLYAGAQAMGDPFYGVWALALAMVASTIANLPWFLAGRRYGYRVPSLLCRISLSPDSCVRQTEDVFERHGVATLLIAKFVPGLAHLAAPLAGAFRFSSFTFLVYNAIGAALWAGAGLILGLIFYTQIDWLIANLSQIGGHTALIAGLLVALYAAYRWLIRRRFLNSLRASRIAVAELQQMMARGEAPVVLDVRSRTHRKLDPRVIPGALLVDLDDRGRPITEIPLERSVVVYCACPNDATAAKVALHLRRGGIREVRALAGGIDAWSAAHP